MKYTLMLMLFTLPISGYAGVFDSGTYDYDPLYEIKKAIEKLTEEVKKQTPKAGDIIYDNLGNKYTIEPVKEKCEEIGNIAICPDIKSIGVNYPSKRKDINLILVKETGFSYCRTEIATNLYVWIHLDRETECVDTW